MFRGAAVAVVGGVALLGISGCGGSSAKNLCPDLERLGNISSPPTYTEINTTITTLSDAQHSDSSTLNSDVKKALAEANAVKTAMGQPGNSGQVDQLLNTLKDQLFQISSDCSQIVAG